MRALVISGGGSKGAYAGGVAEYLTEVSKNKYDLFVGTSTGSLIVPLLALGRVNQLFETYTKVNQDSIFNVNPFTTKKKDGETIVTFNYRSIIKRVLLKKHTFGESENLKKLIYQSFSPKDFEEIKRRGVNVVVTVSNLTKGKVEYKSISDYDYEEFCDWIWISCNYVPFMSLAERDDCQYADGGFGGIVPIREAIRLGATSIDAIVLEPQHRKKKAHKSTNPFSLMMNLFTFMLSQIEYGNVIEGDLAAQIKEVDLTLYFTPDKLTENSLIFDKDQMKKWWKMGYDYAAEKAEEESQGKGGIISQWWNYLKKRDIF